MNVSHRMTALTRLGFAARGLLYIVIAVLLFRSGRSEGASGALAELGKSGGDPLLLAMAAGFVAYGIWRLADTALNIEGHEQGAKGAGTRIAAGVSGIAYSALAWQAFKLMDGAGSGSGDRAEEGARTALALPGGPLLLVLGGAILVGAGIFQLVKAYRYSFCDHLDPAVAREPWVRWMGRGGYSARGIIFMVSGFFLVRAGLDSEASKAGGMEEALRWLDSPVDLAVGAGLLLFGLFSLVEARFRRIHDVPLDEVAHAIDPRS
jgi:hypothetical protein